MGFSVDKLKVLAPKVISVSGLVDQYFDKTARFEELVGLVNVDSMDYSVFTSIMDYYDSLTVIPYNNVTEQFIIDNGLIDYVVTDLVVDYDKLTRMEIKNNTIVPTKLIKYVVVETQKVGGFSSPFVHERSECEVIDYAHVSYVDNFSGVGCNALELMKEEDQYLTDNCMFFIMNNIHLSKYKPYIKQELLDNHSLLDLKKDEFFFMSW